jgi:phosphoribosylcarboxyaminoimidazole (NCAIR) mutase
MISTIIIAIAEAKMYVLVFDAGGAAVGAGVAAADTTSTPVFAFDP